MEIYQPIVSGSLDVTGPITAQSGITGSLFGTSSWAQNSLTASIALNAEPAAIIYAIALG